jgi:pilus assembly protein CpaD
MFIPRRKGLLKPAIVLLSGMLLIAACAPRTENWSGFEGPKQPEVNWAEFHHKVHFAPASSRLDDNELAGVTRFLSRIGKGDGVRISLVAGNQKNARLALRRETILTDRLREQGFNIFLGTTDQKGLKRTESGNVVRITVGRYVVTPPRCPYWSKPATGDENNEPSSNYGCATASNLTLMVSDPGDLIRSRATGPGDGEALANGIDAYRAGKIEKANPIPSLSGMGGG